MNAPIMSILISAGLFVPLLAALYRQYRKQKEEIAVLRHELQHEKEGSRLLQTQFEKEIEQRTFELQRTVGALNREIGERTQAEGELQKLQKQQELILDSAGEGILGLDNHGRVIFMNIAAEVMLGWSKEELLGNTHHERIHHTNADGSTHPVETCPIYMAYRDGKVHFKTGDVFWNKNNTSFPVEYVSTPIRDEGMLKGAVVVFRDMNTFT